MLDSEGAEGGLHSPCLGWLRCSPVSLSKQHLLLQRPRAGGRQLSVSGICHNITGVTKQQLGTGIPKGWVNQTHHHPAARKAAPGAEVTWVALGKSSLATATLPHSRHMASPLCKAGIPPPHPGVEAELLREGARL